MTGPAGSMDDIAHASPAGGTQRHVGVGLVVAFLAIVLDQLTKWWLVQAIAGNGGRFFHVLDVFDIVLVHNRGVSFGMFNNDDTLNALLFSLLAAAIVVVLLVWLWRAAELWLALAIGLVIGGAIGNVIDRVRLGFVIDFLDFHLGSAHFPSFNVADSAICVGVTVMIIDGLLGRRKAR